MAKINSRKSGHRTRPEMTGTLDSYLGISVVLVDRLPTLRLNMTAADGRHWYVALEADETAQLMAACEPLRTLKAATTV